MTTSSKDRPEEPPRVLKYRWDAVYAIAMVLALWGADGKKC